MALDSIAMTSQVTALQIQIAALQSQLATAVQQVVIGDNQPTTVQQTLTWLKTTSGIFDATYRYHNNSWYTPMPFSIGTIQLFRVGSGLPIGFVPATDATLPVISGFNWYEFTGASLLVLSNLAYRKYSQAFLQ